MKQLVRQFRMKAEWHARRTAMLEVGGVLLAIGGGFIVAAAWIARAPRLGALGTSLVIGAAFSGSGLVVLGLRRSGSAPHRVSPRLTSACGACPGRGASFAPREISRR